jgi:hypothetical protein
MPSKIFGTVLSHGLRGRMLTRNDPVVNVSARPLK